MVDRALCLAERLVGIGVTAITCQGSRFDPTMLWLTRRLAASTADHRKDQLFAHHLLIGIIRNDIKALIIHHC